MTESDLRTSTRHLASRIIRNPLAKGSAWNGAAQVVGSLGTFLGTVVAAWLLGLKDFGGLSVVQATVGVITGLAGLGMGMVVTRFVAKYLEVDILRAGDHLSTAVGAIIISTLVMAPIYLALCPWIAQSVLHHPSLVRPLEIATPLIVIGPLAGVLGSISSGRSPPTGSCERCSTQRASSSGASSAGSRGPSLVDSSATPSPSSSPSRSSALPLGRRGYLWVGRFDLASCER